MYRIIGYACEGDLKRLKECLYSGVDINFKNKYKETPLMAASKYNHLNIAEFVIGGGAYIDAQNKNGYTALIFASIYGHLDIVKFLISKGADINVQTKGGYTALICASCHGELDIVEFLKSLKGSLRLTHIILNLIEEKGISKGELPDILFVR